jgi:hypothetical protein
MEGHVRIELTDMRFAGARIRQSASDPLVLPRGVEPRLPA